MDSVGWYSQDSATFPSEESSITKHPLRGKRDVKSPAPHFWADMWLRGIGQRREWRIRLSSLLMTSPNSWWALPRHSIKSSYESQFPGRHLCARSWWAPVPLGHTPSGPFPSLCVLGRMHDWEPSCVCALLPACCMSHSCALGALLGSQISAIHPSLQATWRRASHSTPGYERHGASPAPHDFSIGWRLQVS